MNIICKEFQMSSAVSTRISAGVLVWKATSLLFWVFFCFFLTGSQDEYVLKRVYSELLQYNPTMKKSSKLEKLAQSHGCVRNHADHRNSWQDKAALRNDPGRRKTLSSIIGKVGCFSDRNSIRFPIRIPKEFLNNSTSIFSRTTV